MEDFIFCVLFIYQIILQLKSFSQKVAVFWSDLSALSPLLGFLAN